MKRLLALALCALAVSTASSQTTTPAAPTTSAAPDRLVGNINNPDYAACISVMEDLKKPSQVGCYTTGTITHFGEIIGTTAKCEDASLQERAAQCMRGQTLKSGYVGYEGPFCAAVLFDARPPLDGNLLSRNLQRTIRVKEVYPCAGRSAPPRAENDVDFVPGTKLTPLKFTGGIRGACINGAKATDTKVLCFARAGVDASGHASVVPAAVCTDPKLTDNAVECIKEHHLNPEYHDAPPKELCLQIQYFGKKLFEAGKGVPAVTAVQLPSCPPGLVQ